MFQWLPALVILLMQGSGQEVNLLGPSEWRVPLAAQVIRLCESQKSALTPAEIALLRLLVELGSPGVLRPSAPPKLIVATDQRGEPEARATRNLACFSCSAKLRDGPRIA
ncbi:MAG: hypothetical protein MUC92_09700 [Fimbriimonadaceae bacterium]|jgi:hypothetical protein|nr:hypothetical protein [Fimbriimonadaceae bacterium]